MVSKTIAHDGIDYEVCDTFTHKGEIYEVGVGCDAENAHVRVFHGGLAANNITYSTPLTTLRDIRTQIGLTQTKVIRDYIEMAKQDVVVPVRSASDAKPGGEPTAAG
jgi:predicted transcriptional regulator